MASILRIIAVVAIVLAAAWFLAGLPGSVSLDFNDTTVRAATPVVALALIVLFVVLLLVWRLLAMLIGLPGLSSRWRRGRRRAAGEAAITGTLLALAAGEKADARRNAARARKLLGETPQTLLLAAEAGRLAQRDDETEAAFVALTKRQDGSFLGYRGLLRQAIDRQDWTEAAVLARKAENAHPGAAWVRQERGRLAVRAGNWAEALELADPDAPRAALAAGAAAAEPDRSKAERIARQAWRADKTLAPAALAYAARLRAAGRESRAQTVLAETWALAPHPDLADFALASQTEPLVRNQAARKLAAYNPSHTESRLLLARTALEAGLTGEARRQTEFARDAGLNERRLWLLLAEIEEAEGGSTEEGRLAQRDALRRAANADADPGWACTVCHVSQAVWHPACPSCHSSGSLRWGNGGRAVSAPMTISGPLDRIETA